MLRPADCQICFALPYEISLAGPTVSCRRSSIRILSVTETAKRRGVVPPTNQGASSLFVGGIGCVVSLVSFSILPVLSYAFVFLLLDAAWFPSAKHPKSTPRVSYSMTHMSIVRRLDFAVVDRMVFKVFPCGLWVVELRSPVRTRCPNQQTNAGRC
ncbi:hypothetical protein K456DRAFT_399005 [Colletotrichum gloeosporioides 23]|nr:hypothetical protein K456DRAFT_399005 [Colletotrichum gloeosporioides 23]